MKCMKKTPLHRVEWVEIENTLESLQSEVGGVIEFLPLGEDYGMLVDEEGKMKESKRPNFWLVNRFGVLIDLIVGNVLFVGVDGEDFCDLSDEWEDEIRALIKKGV